MEKTSGFFTRDITETRVTDKEGAGILRWVGNKCYRWVLNSTTTTLTIGGAYYWGTAFTSVNGLFGEIFTFGQAAKGTSENLLAGIAVSAIPAGQYGWIQVYGENAATLVEGTVAVAATDNLKGVTGQLYLIKSTATAVAPGNKNTAIALAAKGTAGAVATNCFIQCL